MPRRLPLPPSVYRSPRLDTQGITLILAAVLSICTSAFVFLGTVLVAVTTYYGRIQTAREKRDSDERARQERIDEREEARKMREEDRAERAAVKAVAETAVKATKETAASLEKGQADLHTAVSESAAEARKAVAASEDAAKASNHGAQKLTDQNNKIEAMQRQIDLMFDLVGRLVPAAPSVPMQSDKLSEATSRVADATGLVASATDRVADATVLAAEKLKESK